MTGEDARPVVDEDVVEQFRANGGRIGGALARTPMVLVHHRGARSGTVRVTPLACHPLGDGRIVVVASNNGSPRHPAWYHNLVADPRVVVEYGAETFPAVATELRGRERAAIWPDIVARYPDVGRFQARTARVLPLIVLTRRAG
jgi:deazaflavin-dependent oxidoreductase (nitroreductase family)